MPDAAHTERALVLVCECVCYYDLAADALGYSNFCLCSTFFYVSKTGNVNCFAILRLLLCVS